MKLATLPADALRRHLVAKRSEREASEPKIAHFVYLALLGLATHWMLLLNDSLYAEDWGLFPALKYGDWNAIVDMFSSAGVPTSILYVLPLSLFVNVLFYKAVNFILILASSALSYLIAVESRLVSPGQAFWMSALFVLAPIYKVYVVFTYYYYFIAYVLFLLATYTALRMYSAPAWWRRLLRVTAIILYVLAFNINSLLVFYFPALAVLMLAEQHRAEAGAMPTNGLIRSSGVFVGRHIDFMLLPFAYWLAKKLFTPTYGIYSSYNAFEIHVGSLLGNFSNFLRNGLISPLAPSIVAAVAVCAILNVAGRVRWKEWHNVGAGEAHAEPAHDNSGKILLFGVAALLAGVIPYCAVGKSPEPGVLMRHALLVPLPVGIVLVGLWGLFRRWATLNRLSAAILIAVFVVPLEVGWWRSYAAWEARSAKDSAITMYIEQHPQWSHYAVYWVQDKDPIRGADNEYGFQEFTARFRMIWGGQTRMAFTPAHIGFFGVESPPGVSPVKARMDTIRKFCISWSSAKDIDLTGNQAILSIRPGAAAASTNAELAAKYMYYRFLAPGQLDNFLRSVAEVTLSPVP